MQQVMEVTREKEALIKVNNAGNEYGRHVRQATTVVITVTIKQME